MEDENTFAFSEAEQLYVDIMDAVIELIAACGAHATDLHVKEAYEQVGLAVRQIYP